MSLSVQSEARSQIRTVWGIQSTGRALDAHWKRQGIQWKMARSEHQRTWLKGLVQGNVFHFLILGLTKKAVRVCSVKVPIICDWWSCYFGLLLRAQRRRGLQVVFISLWAKFKLTSTPKQGKNTSLHPSEAEQSQAKQGAGRWESWLGDSVFY